MKNIQIETGDCLLVSSKGFLPEAIQWFQGNKFNHAAFFLWLNGILYVIEADKHGIALTKFKDYIESDKGLLVLKPKNKLSNQMKSDIIDFVLEYTGHTPYEYINLLFYQPIRYIAKKVFNKEIWVGRSSSKSNKKFICGEWVAFIYNKFLNLFDNWNEVAPVDIFNNEENFNHYKYEKNICKKDKLEKIKLIKYEN